LYGNKSVAVAADVDRDGDLDLFVGGRVIAGSYGIIPRSHLLINNGKGKFTVADDEKAPGLNQIGMVTGAVWDDIDKDGWDDLIIVGEWMPVTIFKNDKGLLKNITTELHLENTSGFWTTITAADINNDGYKDLLVGNWGENSKLHASEAFPLKLYVGDIDGNGSIDQLLAVEVEKKYYPFLGKEEFEKQLPGLIKKKYLDYSSMANVTIDEIFGTKLASMKLLSVNILSSIIITNNKGTLTVDKLPPCLQWSPVFSFCTGDFNGDGKTDIISGGNFYGVNPYEGRYDAAAMKVLLNAGDHFDNANKQSGISISGEVRDIKSLETLHDKQVFLLARNNDSMRIIMPNFKR